MFNPETHIVASWVDGAHYAYTALHKDREVTFRVAKSALSRTTPGQLGVPQRRAMLSAAFEKALHHHE